MLLFALAAIASASHSEGFDRLIALRRFEDALAEATTDSARAEVLEAAGEFAAAASLWQEILDDGWSPRAFAGKWEAISSCASDPALAGRLLSEEICGIPGDPGPDGLLSLCRSASDLGQSALADSLAGELLESWPRSREAMEYLAGEFYDVQYPVWSDDSAKIAVLRDFIERRGRFSGFWRSRAWQYLLGSLLSTADSTDWREVHGEWLASCPESPQAWLTGAALLIDRDSSFSEALSMTDSCAALLEEGWRPEDIAPGEAALVETSIRLELAFRRAQALLGTGRPADAARILEPVLEPGSDGGPDGNATTAACWWLMGRILHRANSPGADRAFLEAAARGDVGNRWTPLAIEALESLGGEGWLDWARRETGYGGPVFQDATGMLTTDSVLPGGRISWFDYDGDGWEDLLCGCRLWRNIEGRAFEEVTESSGLSAFVFTGGIGGDLDGDGDADLVASGDPPLILLDEEGRFENMSCAMGMHPTEGPVEGVGLLDWNADGLLDIYLACYERSGSLGEGCPDVFLLGGEDGFTSAAVQTGMVTWRDIPLCGRGVSPCDFDRDGDIDIFVSVYRLQENLMWVNEGGAARNSALELGIAGAEKDGWWGHTIGSAWADFDNDGDWDLFSANLAHPRYIDISDRSMLLVNDSGSFHDERALRGIRYEETHSVPVWGDFDCDGLLDLYITSIYEGRRSFLYRQLPDGSFEDVTLLSGTRVMNGWGAAAADFDQDGRLDLAVGSATGSRLFRNVTEGGSWLLVRVEPPEGVNPYGIGCTVEIESGGRVFLRQIPGGSGTTCQDGALLHFGLGACGEASWRLYVPGEASPAASGRLDGVCRLVTVP